jgi:hypothetical protein
MFPPGKAAAIELLSADSERNSGIHVVVPWNYFRELIFDV